MEEISRPTARHGSQTIQIVVGFKPAHFASCGEHGGGQFAHGAGVRCIDDRAGHARADQRRGVGHGTHDGCAGTEQIAVALQRDASGDADDQWFAHAHRLANFLQHRVHDVGFDGENDHIGLGGQHGVVLQGHDAMVGDQLIAAFAIGFGHQYPVRVMTGCDQSADQTGCHIAATNKADGFAVHIRNPCVTGGCAFTARTPLVILPAHCPRFSGLMPDQILAQYASRLADADVYEVAIKSPLEFARKLSERLGHRVWLKREDLQPVFSFKLRGAYNKLRCLSEQERQCGVIAASAGNHAQGLALAAKRMGLRAVIVMPSTTPSIKVDNVRAHGGEVVLHGDTFDVASEHAMALSREHKLTYVHPYDDPDVIAGQATVGREILEQYSEKPDVIFVPVGGGGLIAGVALAVKAAHPEIRIIGVEPEDAACLKLAMDSGERGVLAQVGLFADGVAVRQIGRHTFDVCRELVDDVVTCNVDEICAAVRDIFEDNRSVAEPAGALALAGLKKYAESDPQRASEVLVAIESGANVNFDRLRHIAERAELGEHREALFAVTIPERPGSFLEFCEQLGRRAVTEFNYRYADSSNAHVFVGVKLSEPGERQALAAAFDSIGFAVTDLSESEMAKVHVRYMVGGRVPGLRNEMLFRFEFPERPGALLAFLKRIGTRWNISLFHYRNHGAAYGRVLVGIQVPEDERSACREALDSLSYAYYEETGNPAYELFLGT